MPLPRGRYASLLRCRLPDDRRPRLPKSIGDSLLPSQIPRPPPVIPIDRSRWAIPEKTVRGLEGRALDRAGSARVPPPGIPFHVSNFGPRIDLNSIQTGPSARLVTGAGVVFGSTGTTLTPDKSREPVTARLGRCADCGSCPTPEAGLDGPDRPSERRDHERSCRSNSLSAVTGLRGVEGKSMFRISRNRSGVLTRQLRRGAILTLLAVGSQSGCTREFYREWANQDVSEAVFEKSRDPRWRIDLFSIEPPALSRFASPMIPSSRRLRPMTRPPKRSRRCPSGPTTG